MWTGASTHTFTALPADHLKASPRPFVSTQGNNVSAEKPKQFYFFFFWVLTTTGLLPVHHPSGLRATQSSSLPAARFALVADVRNLLQDEVVHLHGCAHVSCDGDQLHPSGDLTSASVVVVVLSPVRAPQTLHKRARSCWDPWPSASSLWAHTLKTSCILPANSERRLLLQRGLT